MADEQEEMGDKVTGRVKWFDVAKGFGFIVSDDGGPDILLHANVLRNFGQGSVADNARITVMVQQTDRGAQAQQVLEIEPPEADPEDPMMGLMADLDPDAPYLAARVKWFDKSKGFGFVNIFMHSADVFVHVEVLRRFGLADLQPGEAVTVRVVDGPRGKMAAEVRSWDYVQED
ncbi:cold shock domain-containing protein [Roseobacter sp. HKCCD9010]|jgi:CspA family cold shock protein|uniref:cold-shock protein n=1 Tax=Rhodobacterales TaxID=204455 RepID=UPI00119A4D87|nr:MULTISPECIES: cold shock domain-containing protein [Rhodobacterales]MBF9050561.1 cold shock domain-containing protein [Rhodobacterales bacterium HKCCD4356]NNV12020.1 cold shock domain-containing protein [Roseobacter sp. HKCCD7357]NNV17034.1 cold shock domain-containing protein [Roseobacter sp. HKCCD8768]NNV26263.1 cold shock domain-containing protein [Roseobacter sp. HKCCD8192]NNV30758.1 cold shock domain-containing protein [Roseobacter sp. HKCCD9061]